jgi:ectoine hydroxylase-related dioxygenase (phytanoyl-CoA dioxygenase family)
VTNHTRSYGVLGSAAPETIAETHAERIRLAGFTVVESRIAPVNLARISAAVDDVMERQARQAGGWEQLASIGEQSTARCCLAYDDLFLAVATDPLVLAVCRLLLGDYIILMQQNAIINPPASGHTQRAYHRDLPYQHFTSSRPIAVSALLCVDPFTASNGSTIVVPGSHKVEQFPSDTVLTAVEQRVEAPAGSYIVFDAMLFHRAGDNRSQTSRRAVNHVYSLPFVSQQISIPAMLGGRYADDPELARLLGYETAPAPSVDAWREARRARKRRTGGAGASN